MEIILYVARQIQGMKQHLVLRMCTLAMNPLILIDLFCAADPKEAITFLEKTKEKVSPQNTTSKILAKKYCFMTEVIKSPAESQSRPLNVLCLF